MAVNSYNSYVETTSWRSEDDVINMTKSASTAGDLFSNEELDENHNNNNNNNTSKDLCLVQSTNSNEKSIVTDVLANSNTDNFISNEPQSIVKGSITESQCSADLIISNGETEMKLDINCKLGSEEKAEEVILQDSKGFIHEHSSTKITDLSQISTTELRLQSIVEDKSQSLATEENACFDPDWIEERFRVDRRKLEQMLQATADGTGQSGEEFFKTVMDESNTQITWPSKLKIGAKSKKDPHIKVCGKIDDVKKARALVMRVLDTKCTKCTLKMDVSHTEHSHVIGKGGNNIKRVMEETECHIHFPDSNRNSTAEKSNQVSIAGQPAGVNSAMNRIRELLPIVISFDFSVSGTIPDPNSPPVQLIVQTYNISVQFKQRVKVYCTATCTVRGSPDNVQGLVEGSMKLMQHFVGGQVLRVTSQLEVAQQQHSYMLGRNACNVKQIMQKTGAQISFPDPNCVPRKNTIYMTGTVEQVVLARQRLMGCLPLVLMFDMKQEESNSATDEAALISRLMESLDVFISVKLKPKQPSKSVIVKSIERNIYKMFEARRQLLKLTTTGLQTPPPTSSPVPISISAPVPPIIRLPHTQSPHIKPQYIGILQSNGVALVNGSMSPLTPAATPTGSTVLRPPAWTPSPMQSPSQSPYPPLTQQATVAAIHAQQQQNILLQAQINAAQQMATLVSASQPGSVVNSPPPAPAMVKSDDSSSTLSIDPLQLTQRFIQENNKVFRSNQTSVDSRLQMGNPTSSTSEENHFSAGRNAFNLPEKLSVSSASDTPMSSLKYNGEGIPCNVRRLEQHVIKVQNQMSANNSFNKGSGLEKTLGHSHSFSDSNVARDEFPHVHQQRLSLTDGIDAKNFLNVSANYKLGVSLHSTPCGSDRNSPQPAADYQALSPEMDITKLNGKLMKSPSSSSSSADLRAAIHNHRSTNRGPFPQTDHLKEPPRTNSFQNNENVDVERKLEDFFKNESTPPPPPGFDNFPLSRQLVAVTNYELLRQKANKAIEKGPVASEVRTPTSCWYGQGFSRSMPSNEWNRAGAKKYSNRLDTNYERDDSMMNEVADPSPDNIALTLSQRLPNSHAPHSGSSALQTWREKNNHSLQAKDMSASLIQRRHHSTFDPQPGEYMNQSLPPPPHPNDDTGSPAPPFSAPSDSASRLQSLSNQPLKAALSLLTNTHLAGQSNGVELQDLLNHLNLQKYSEVFIKQEVDLQTFLTLTDSDLVELGISAFGPRKKILLAIEQLKKHRSVLYERTRSAAPGTSGHLRTQSLHSATGGFLQEQAPSDSASLSSRIGFTHSPSNKLLNGARGMVSQSGRW